MTRGLAPALRIAGVRSGPAGTPHEPRTLQAAPAEQQGGLAPDAPRREDHKRCLPPAVHAGLLRPHVRAAVVDKRPARDAAGRRHELAVRRPGPLRLDPADRLLLSRRGGRLLHPRRSRLPVRGTVRSSRAALLQAGEDLPRPARDVRVLLPDLLDVHPLLAMGLPRPPAGDGDGATPRHGDGADRPDRGGVGLHPGAEDPPPHPGGRRASGTRGCDAASRGPDTPRDRDPPARVGDLPRGAGPLRGLHSHHIRRAMVPRFRRLGRGGTGHRRGPARARPPARC